MKVPTLARRHVLAALLAAQTPTLVRISPVSAASVVSDGRPAAAADLLALIPSTASGAPATNLTVAKDIVAKIDAQTALVEAQFDRRDVIRDSNLNGSWRLLYSDAREFTSLAAGFPGGFELGPTYQPVDLATGRFENQASVFNRFGVATLSTCVVGDVSPAPSGGLNAVGVRNERGNRIDVNFKRITFSLDEIFGQPVSNVRKVLVPKPKVGVAQPANDVTYLDTNMRITRGGDGSLFVFVRGESPRPLLSVAERQALYSLDEGAPVVVGNGAADDDAPAEIKRLLQQPTAGVRGTY